MQIQKRAMLLGTTLKLGGLLGERRDRGASAFTAEKYAAAEKRVKTSKYLIDRQHPKVKAVQAAAQRVRDIVYKYSFPWGDSGLRLLPVKANDEFRAKLVIAESEFWNAVDDYLLAYPSLVYEAEQSLTGLGGLFDPREYPRKDQIRDLFKLQIEYWPIPESGHFVADIATEAADEARAALSKMTTERANEAVNDMLARIEKAMTDPQDGFITKLAGYRKDPNTAKVVKTFRDSLTENVEELGRLVKKLNFNDDPGLDNLAEQIIRLGRYSCEVLRDDSKSRQEIIGEAKSLIGKLDGFRKTDAAVDSLIDAVSEYM